MADATTTTTTTAVHSTTTNPTFYDQSYSSVTFSLYLNGGLCVIVLCLFEVLLRWRPSFAAPRLEQGLPRGLLGWARLACRTSGSPVHLDPDAEVVVRFCTMGFKFSLLGSLLDCVLLPLYYGGAGHAEEFNQFSVSNLAPGSDRFWGVVVGAYILTPACAYLLSLEWAHYLALRSKHLGRTAAGRGSGGEQAAQARRSVMVELLPPDYRDEGAVQGFFESLFGPGSVRSCVVARGESSAQMLGHAIPALEPARQFMTRELAPAGEPMLPQASTDAQAIARDLGHQALGAVQVLQDATIGRTTSSTAFVTFRSVALAVEAQQVRLSQTGAWTVREAPEPRDLIWQNVAKPLPQVLLRHTLAQVLCTMGLIFWSIPVTLIQGWAQIGNLQTILPFITKFQALPIIYTFLTDYLPVLALIGLQCLLPSLFEFMAVHYEGHKTKSDVQRIILNRCFGYQLASLCVTIITGSIWIQLESILKHPANLLSLLSTSLPKVAVYFVTFVLARAGLSLPMLILRPWDLPRRPAPTARCAFGAEAANAALVLVIGLTYSFIAPAILPACALYFGFATVTYRWLFAYVYEPEFDGRGAFFYDLFNSALLGLLVGTMALIAVCTLRATKYQVAFLTPLPFAVAWYGHRCWKHLGLPSQQVALADAVAADSQEAAPESLADMYTSPKPTRRPAATSLDESGG